MSKTIFPWVKPLGLSSSDFSTKPEGADTLLWGLKNNIVPVDEYLVWASEYYKLPAIKAEFFSMAVDFSLIEKYAHVYDWNSTCYPIYQWEGTTFIACLEPPKNEINLKICTVIAPFHALESAWQKYENGKAGMPPTTEQIPIMQDDPAPVAAEPPAPTPVEKKNASEDLGSLDFGALKEELGVNDKEAKPEPVIKENQPSADVGSLDFSQMADPVQPLSAEPETTEENNGPTEEVTQTTIDADLNNFTSATQTMHASAQTITAASGEGHPPEMPFDNLTIKDISLEGETVIDETPKQETTRLSPTLEAQKDLKTPKIPSPAEVIVPPPPKMANVTPPVKQKADISAQAEELELPSLDDLKSHQTENPQQAPGLENPEMELDQESNSSDSFEDDYTPVPVITRAQQEAQAKRKAEAQQQELEQHQSSLTENTITDHSQPIHTPPENQITNEDLKASDELENAQTMKLVIAHFFGHLKRDYQKLMWVEKNGDELYFPKYVYGDWKITTLAWRMHINTVNPNIFKVAYSSGLPFHGEINPNPFNDKYFEWWSRGKCPDMATIYPIKVDEEIIGFICGFGKNSEFDELGSLKKIENLYAICKKAILKQRGLKAA